MTAPAARTVFELPKMDCAAEEQMVRIALDGHPQVRALRFDLAARRVEVIHEGGADNILARLTPLGLGTSLVESASAPDGSAQASDVAEAITLKLLLAVNAAMFAIELLSGFVAQSTGLIADSLDMFADAAVYAISLYAVGKTATLKLRAAHMSGWLQLLLAVGAFAEVARRFIVGSDPEPPYMIAVASLALVANVICLYLIARHRGGEPHMRASWIFSTNDVIANCGVIAAGVVVAWTGSRLPDLIIGAIIAAVVFIGALRILRLR